MRSRTPQDTPSKLGVVYATRGFLPGFPFFTSILTQNDKLPGGWPGEESTHRKHGALCLNFRRTFQWWAWRFFQDRLRAACLVVEKPLTEVQVGGPSPLIAVLVRSPVSRYPAFITTLTVTLDDFTAPNNDPESGVSIASSHQQRSTPVLGPGPPIVAGCQSWPSHPRWFLRPFLDPKQQPPRFRDPPR